MINNKIEISNHDKNKEPIEKRYVIALITMIIIITIIIISNISNNNSTSDNFNNENIDIQYKIETINISPDAIYKDYQNNEINADLKYKDKLMVLSGEINEIGKDYYGNPYVKLNTNKLFVYVICSFSEKDIETLAKLSKNQLIKIQGTCKGISLLEIKLTNCSLIK